MRCRNYKLLASDYIDGLLGESDRSAYIDHLARCPGCRTHLTETRSAVDFLKKSTSVAAPMGLFEGTIAALERDSEPSLAIVSPPVTKARIPRFDHDLLSLMRHFVVNNEFKLVSYGVGMVASCVLMLGTLNALKGVGVIFQPQTPTIWISVQESEVMGLEPRDGFAMVAYTIPKVTASGGLPQFAATAQPSENEIMVLADVGTDGRASIVEVLSGPSDPQFVARLENALYRPSFTPAKTKSGRAVPSRVVLLVQQVEVVG